MNRVTLVDSHWHGSRLRLVAAGRDGTLHDLDLDGTFAWDVGDVMLPDRTPRYVFEPRSMDAIEADLQGATDADERGRLAAERELCQRPHVVYAAFYGVLPKVGMTQDERLPTRLREQGADAGFVIAHCPERAAARAAERAVARLYRLPEFRRHTEVMRQLMRPVDWSGIEQRARDLRRRLSDHFSPDDVLVRIDEVPLAQPLPAPPHFAQARGHHAGTWLGAKGNLLFYQARRGSLDVGKSPVAALRRQDLVGRIIDVA